MTLVMHLVHNKSSEYLAYPTLKVESTKRRQYLELEYLSTWCICILRKIQDVYVHNGRY